MNAWLMAGAPTDGLIERTVGAQPPVSTATVTGADLRPKVSVAATV